VAEEHKKPDLIGADTLEEIPESDSSEANLDGVLDALEEEEKE
jgi:hypothetical protein